MKVLGDYQQYDSHTCAKNISAYCQKNPPTNHNTDAKKNPRYNLVTNRGKRCEIERAYCIKEIHERAPLRIGKS